MSDEATTAEAPVDAPPAGLPEGSKYTVADWEKAKEETMQLSAVPAIAEAYNQLVVSRQLYAASRQILLEALTRRGAHELVEDVLVKAAAHQATKQFALDDLCDSLLKRTLPFITNALTVYEKEAERRELTVKTKEQEVRRKQSLKLGPLALARDRTHCFAGPDLGQVTALLNHLHDSHDSDDLVTVRFSRALERVVVDDGPTLILPFRLWKGCAENTTRFTKFVTEEVVKRLNASWIDLLIVDDLAYAHKPLLGVSPHGRALAAAHQAIRRFCDAAGCALLAGAQYSDAEQLTELSQHATLSQVTLRETPEEGLRLSTEIDGNPVVVRTSQEILDGCRPRIILT